MDTSPSGFQCKAFGEGGIPQVTVLKDIALDVGSKSSATQGEAGSLEFPPPASSCMLCQGGFYDKPFLPVSVWVFSLSLDMQELLGSFLNFFQRNLFCM